MRTTFCAITSLALFVLATRSLARGTNAANGSLQHWSGGPNQEHSLIGVVTETFNISHV